MGIQARINAIPQSIRDDIAAIDGNKVISGPDMLILACAGNLKAYRDAHHKDVELISIVAHLWRGPFPLIRSITVLKD